MRRPIQMPVDHFVIRWIKLERHERLRHGAERESHAAAARVGTIDPQKGEGG
jgi:hypothetical protein